MSRKALKSFPKKRTSISAKNAPYRLKCNTGNFQCGARCMPVSYRNKKGDKAYTNCRKNAEGMAKNGLEWLEYVADRGARVQKINKERGTNYTVDSQGRVKAKKATGDRQVKGETMEQKVSRLATFDMRNANQESFNAWKKEQGGLTEAERQAYNQKRAEIEAEKTKQSRAKSSQKAVATKKRKKEETEKYTQEMIKTSEGMALLQAEKDFDAFTKGVKGGNISELGMDSFDRLSKAKAEAKVMFQIRKDFDTPSDGQKEYDQKQPQDVNLDVGEGKDSAWRIPNHGDLLMAKPGEHGKLSATVGFSTSMGIPWVVADQGGKERVIAGAKLEKDGKEVALFDTEGGVLRIPTSSSQRGRRLVEEIGEGKHQAVTVAKLHEMLKGDRQVKPEFDQNEFWLMDENFDRSRYPDFALPPKAMTDASVAKKFYLDLTKKYTKPEQKRNAKKLYDQLSLMIEMGAGARKPFIKVKLNVDPAKDKIGFWLTDNNFDRSRFTDFDLPANAKKDASVARQFYLELSKKYHPDRGGSEEQMANARKLYDQLLVLIEFNEWAEKPTKKRGKKITDTPPPKGEFDGNGSWFRDDGGVDYNKVGQFAMENSRYGQAFQTIKDALRKTGDWDRNSSLWKDIKYRFDEGLSLINENDLANGKFRGTGLTKAVAKKLGSIADDYHPLIKKSELELLESKKETAIAKPDPMVIDREAVLEKARATEAKLKEKGKKQREDSKNKNAQLLKEKEGLEQDEQIKLAHDNYLAKLEDEGVEAWLPTKFSISNAVRYVNDAWGNPFKSKAELEKQIKANADVISRGSFQVGYGDGRNTASGFQAQRGLSYDQFSRESVDKLVSSAIAKPDPKPTPTATKSQNRQVIDLTKEESLAKRSEAEKTRAGRKFIKNMDQFLLRPENQLAQLVDYNPTKETVTILKGGKEITYAGNSSGDYYEVKQVESVRVNPFQSPKKENHPGNGENWLVLGGKQPAVYQGAQTATRGTIASTVNLLKGLDGDVKVEIDYRSDVDQAGKTPEKALSMYQQRLEKIAKDAGYTIGDVTTKKNDGVEFPNVARVTLTKNMGDRPSKGNLIKVGLGQELESDAIEFTVSSERLADPSFQEGLKTLKQIEDKKTRSTGDVIRYKKIVDDLLLAPIRDDVMSSFTPEEKSKVREAIEIFTRSHKTNTKNQVVNASDYVSLRNIEAGKQLRSKDDRQYLRNAVEGVNLLLSKAPKHDGPIYRGIDFSPVASSVKGGREALREKRNQFIADLKEKGEITLDAFSSFTTRPSIAEQFAAGMGRDGTTSVVFRVKQNNSGVNIASFSKLPEEGEVLVPRNARYKVLGVEEKPIDYRKSSGEYRFAMSPKRENIVYVDLEEIAPASTKTQKNNATHLPSEVEASGDRQSGKAKSNTKPVTQEVSTGQQLIDAIGTSAKLPKGARRRDGRIFVTRDAIDVHDPEWVVRPGGTLGVQNLEQLDGMYNEMGKALYYGNASRGYNKVMRRTLKSDTPTGAVSKTMKEIGEAQTAIAALDDYYKKRETIYKKYSGDTDKKQVEIETAQRGQNIYAYDTRTEQYKPATIAGVSTKNEEISYRFADGKTGKDKVYRVRNDDFNPEAYEQQQKEIKALDEKGSGLGDKAEKSRRYLDGLDAFIRDSSRETPIAKATPENVALKVMFNLDSGNPAEVADYIEKVMIGKAYAYSAQARYKQAQEKGYGAETTKAQLDKANERLNETAAMLRQWAQDPATMPARVRELYQKPGGDRQSTNFSEIRLTRFRPIARALSNIIKRRQLNHV